MQCVDSTIVIELYKGAIKYQTRKTKSHDQADDIVATAEELGYKVVQYVVETYEDGSIKQF